MEAHGGAHNIVINKHVELGRYIFFFLFVYVYFDRKKKSCNNLFAAHALAVTF